MSSFVDFAALKAAISIDRVAEWLQLDLKKQQNGQLRGCCPMHQGKNEREFVITPSKGLFFCFGPCGGGDCIKLTAQVLNIGTKEAAQRIAEHFEFGKGTSKEPSTSTVQVPPRTTESGPKSGDSLKPLENLSTDHEAIEALGLTAEVCVALGVGYCSKGMMRGRVVFPLRTLDGRLAGYAGLATTADMAPLMLLPKNLAERVSAPAAAPPQATGTDDVRTFLRVVK